MSSAVNGFVCAIHECSQEVPHNKWNILFHLNRFPLSNHHFVALVLLYNNIMRLERSFCIRVVPELCDIKSQKISAQPRGVSVHYLYVYEVSDDFCWKCLLFVSRQGLRTATSSSRGVALSEILTVRAHGHTYQFQYADYKTHAETTMDLTCLVKIKLQIVWTGVVLNLRWMLSGSSVSVVKATWLLYPIITRICWNSGCWILVFGSY